MQVAISQTANPNGVSASSNVATYSNQSIGVAAPNRIIVVAVAVELASATPSGCTIDYGNGDEAMTPLTGGNEGAVYSQLYWKKVPTGTTATIKVTYSSTNPSSTQNHIAVYRVIGGKVSSSGADNSTDMDSTDRLTTGSITIPSNGGFLAVASCATDTNAKTWANAGEDLDVDAGALRFTTAFRVTPLTTTAVTCTGTSNREDGALSYVIFAEDVSPTVALNSPADEAEVTEELPTLEFTGTDTEGQDIRYKLQVASDNQFSTGNIEKGTVAGQRGSGGDRTVSIPIVSGQNAIVAVCTSQDSNTANLGVAGITRNSENFSQVGSTYGGSGGSGIPVNIQIWILLNPSVGTFDAVVDFASGINECTVTFFPLSGVNTSDAVNNSNGDTGTGSVSVVTDEDDCYLIAGLVSEATISGVGGGQDDDASYVDQSFENTRVSSKMGGAAGSQSMSFSSSGSNLAVMVVAINKQTGGGSIIHEKISGTDTGFSNPDVGGDTDPFNSGENIIFEFQAGDEFVDGTYYWRVSGIDPSGSNTYGAWSSIRSFTVALVTATPKDVSDSGSGSEAVSIVALLQQSESGDGQEVLDIMASFNLSDTAEGDDLASIFQQKILSDSGTHTDLLNILRMIVISDTAGATEALNVLAQVALSDTGQAIDALNVLAAILISDSALGNDTASILASLIINETANATDAITILANILLTDAGEAEEVLSLFYFIAISDSAVASEVITVLAMVAESDSGSATDALDILRMVAQTDTASGTEALNILAEILQSDSGSGDEVLSILTSLAIQDEGNGSEALQILASILIDDTAEAVEAIDILTALANIGVSDSGLGSDAIDILRQIAISDTANANEALAIFVYVALQDTGSGEDTISNLFGADITDTGAGNDDILTMAFLSLSDDGQGNDLISILASISLSETASGLDEVQKFVSILTQDTGDAQDDISISSEISLSDIGTTSDLIQVLANILISDTGSGIDLENVEAQAHLVFISDNATGDENIRIFIQLVLTDTASGVDTISTLLELGITDNAVANEVLNLLRMVQQSETGQGLDEIQKEVLVHIQKLMPTLRLRPTDTRFFQEHPRLRPSLIKLDNKVQHSQPYKK